ncbi:hypothetical protein [Burkholderia vietnamiensis]|uniref:hypothetical protein n=1 Tax=Burkholderia vietnamiensis TaxID=60552 RepID=UPI001B9DE60A|nr:hypothetical protein [Burkholderia vietnamiensis]MBR8084576.1 hypothetical protein [Burkholderia vietnamiensis]MCA8198362.1 hypothetical protein [Burkholderia vietnamiensis]
MSTWGDVAAAVSKFAPILGNAIPGVGTVVGAGVGLAASVIAKALGTDPTPDSIMKALASNPDAIVKLKQAEMDHERDLAQIGAQREAAQLAYQQSVYSAEATDRDSARELAAKQPRDWMRPVLSVVIIAATIAIVMMVLLGVADGTLRDPVIAATAGGLVMYFVRESSQVLGFWFGMTKEASTQTQAITQFAVSPGSVTPATSDAKSTN